MFVDSPETKQKIKQSASTVETHPFLVKKVKTHVNHCHNIPNFHQKYLKQLGQAQ